MKEKLILELALWLLPKVTVGTAQFMAWIGTLRQSAMQSEEWTDEYEQTWRAGMLSHNLRPEEIPDPR